MRLKNSLFAIGLIVLTTTSPIVGAQINSTTITDGSSFADSVTGKLPPMTAPKGFGPFDAPLSAGAVSAANVKGSIGQLGVAAMNRCKNYVPTGDPVKDQECAGVNFMANNCIQPNATQRSIISGASNTPVASGNCSGSYGSAAGSFDLSSQDNSMISNFGNAANGAAPSSCVTVDKIVSPAVSETFTCTKNLIYSEVNCTQDFNPTYGYATSPFQVNNGPQVAPFSAGTFNYTVTLDGLPSKIILNQYKADNYGQLWVNGQLVMSNALGGMTDLRNGYVTTTPQNCDWDGYCTGGDFIFMNADGSRAYFYDDGCNWGCRGVYPASDITSYFKPGANQITSACANAMAWGDCVINISMQAYGITDTAWANNCAIYEQASGVTLGNPE